VRRRVVVAAGAVAAAAGVGAGWWARRGGADDDAVAALFAQRYQRPDGGELSLAPWRGRPLVVNFWATWCPPCVKELPAFDRFHREQQAWAVVALAIDGPAQVREFLQRVPVSLPIGIAAVGGSDLMRALGNVQGGLPFTVLVDARGRVRWRHMGETTLEQLQQAAREAA
jgi:thiol-disulfide isomerase/thioredoxin